MTGRTFELTPLRGSARWSAIALAALLMILIAGLVPVLPAPT